MNEFGETPLHIALKGAKLGVAQTLTQFDQGIKYAATCDHNGYFY